MLEVLICLSLSSFILGLIIGIKCGCMWGAWAIRRSKDITRG